MELSIATTNQNGKFEVKLFSVRSENNYDYILESGILVSKDSMKDAIGNEYKFISIHKQAEMILVQWRTNRTLKDWIKPSGSAKYKPQMLRNITEAYASIFCGEITDARKLNTLYGIICD